MQLSVRAEVLLVYVFECVSVLYVHQHECVCVGVYVCALV